MSDAEKIVDAEVNPAPEVKENSVEVAPVEATPVGPKAKKAAIVKEASVATEVKKVKVKVVTEVSSNIGGVNYDLKKGIEVSIPESVACVLANSGKVIKL
jgi:hypothetical protein